MQQSYDRTILKHLDTIGKLQLGKGKFVLSTKVLVIIGTGDKDKALAGLMYALNALKNKWLDDVKVVFFGPSEQLAAYDLEVGKAAKDIVDATDCFACKAISDRKGVSGDLEQIGIKIEYVGTVISDLLKEGYIPMVW